MRSAKSTGTPVDPSAPALITLRRHLQLHLRPSLSRLRGVQSAITTSALALRQQNADADADVAQVLLRCGADPLDAEIERIEAAIDALDGKAAPETAPAIVTPHLAAVA